MFPLIISTIPENGSENVSLDSSIQIAFSESLSGELPNETVNPTNVKLYNDNTGEELLAGVDLIDSGKTIRITSTAPTSGGDHLEGLTEYRVLISGLESAFGEVMFGTFELRFMTTESDAVYMVDETLSMGMFEVLMTYPKDQSVAMPNEIKIKCSETIDVSTDKSGVMVLEDSDFESIDEAKFVGENIILQEDVSISGDTILIDTSKLDRGKKYSVIISDIENSSKESILPYMYSFYSTFSSFYSGIADIRNISGFKKLLDGYSAYEIAVTIYDNSRLAEFIAEEADNYDNIDWAGPALYVTKYVSSKTQYDILFNRVLELSSGPTQKVLEDLSITYGYSIGDLLKLVDKLKLEYIYWENYLKGRTSSKAAPGTFVRGDRGDEVPEYKNRQLRDREGTKTW